MQVLSGRPQTTNRKTICLNDDQINSYHQAGYLIIEKLFSQQECEAMLDIIMEQMDEDLSPILNLDRTVPELRKIMKDARIVSILERLQNTEMVGLQSQMIVKAPQTPHASQAWTPHQDSSYVQCEENTYVNAHIALEDHDVENGCLYTFSGSHREGQFPYEPTKGHGQAIGKNPGNKVIDEIITKYEDRKIDLEIKKGDTVFMDGNTIHGSYPNTTKNRSRPVVTFCYINKGAPFLVGRNAKREEILLH